MKQKVEQFILKGMQRDTSISKVSNEFSFENYNIRITAREKDSLLSITNEKGNKAFEDIYLYGTILGYANINRYLIVFTKEAGIDYIERIEFTDAKPIKTNLFTGDLNFKYDAPIEPLAVYENEDIQKVYWVDGVNQPRMINIVALEEDRKTWTNTSFDAVPTLKLEEEVEITRNTIANGVFPPGVLQYVFTYFNKYGQESNPFYTSPLYYTSYDDRGGSPEDKVSNSFNIKINNVDPNFDYIRIYSILRTSLDATPEVKKVADVVPSLSNILIYKELGDQTSASGRFDSALGVSNNSSIEKFVLYPRIKYKNDEPISINELQYHTHENTIRILIDPHNEVLLSNGKKSGIYNILKVPWSGYSFWYFYIYEPTYITFTISENGYVESYTLESARKGNASFYKGKDIVYKESFYYEYNDDGTTGESVDPTELLYVGGESIIANTLAQKDNTLFLGNLKLKRSEIAKKLRDNLPKSISYSYDSTITLPEPKGNYPYENSLKYNSYRNKTFKFGEYYRFGLQFQHKTGKWSEAIWVDDAKNTLHPKYVGDKFFTNSIQLPMAEVTLSKNVIELIEKNDYVKVRPLIVYPTFNDRECICQGILCPTVYNLKDRLDNAPFIQSSWFVRPDQRTLSLDPPIPVNNVEYNFDETNSLAGLLEFRHNRPIPSSRYKNGEIQCIWDPLSTTELQLDDSYFSENDRSKLNLWASNHSECFYVDKSILTFHSPDIEFDDNVQNLNGENIKLRIVGFVPLTSSYGDIDIQTSTPTIAFPDFGSSALGFYDVGAKTYSRDKGVIKSVISDIYWMDGLTKNSEPVASSGILGAIKELSLGYMIYPFHRNGSLNNQRYASKEGNTKSSLLKTKKLSNFKYSYNSYYLDYDNIWNADGSGNKGKKYNGISDVKIINTNEIEMFKLKAPLNSGLDDLVYYSNIDKVITFNISGAREDALYKNRFYGYPITASSKMANIGALESGEEDSPISYEDIHSGYVKHLHEVSSHVSSYLELKTQDFYSVDPVRMKYKSTPHAILALNYAPSGEQFIIPTLFDHSGINSDVNNTVPVYGNRFYWCNTVKTNSAIQDNLELSHNLSLPSDFYIKNTNIKNVSYLWLAELYNDTIVNRFGGTTEEAIENNTWLPCGEAVSIYNNGILKSTMKIKWTEGDTYYQRYDHIKTYPFTLEDQNCITDIVSFMCETRVNLDGRYDRNRGNLSNFAITPENFNKINDVYNQNNNFFVYKALNYDKFSLDNFPNSITWTKEKQLGELVDTWTNITMASTLDLDGEKGEVSSLNTFNNEIFAFQKHGISHILFNSRVQIPASDGVPIEITNGLKVDGKRYLSEIGTHNKWSIVTTPNGIYFIDNITNGIYLFTGESLEPLSEKLGFSQWVGKYSSMNKWDYKYDNFRTFYDKVNGDVYFTTKDASLCFSETLGQFTSFMSYENLPAMFNIDNKFYSIKDSKIWEHNAGEYNNIYGELKPYYIKYRVSPDPYMDKTFTNIEFRSDTFDNEILTDITFNKLLVENEYQKGESELKYNKITPSNLKKKFRMWRADIPRDTNKKLNRMRNPWIYLQLLKDATDNYRTEFHDLLVYYFE